VRLAILLSAAALAVAGCGGDGGGGGSAEPASDEDQIRAVIDEAYGAFAAGDAATFCGDLTADYLADFEENYGPCEDATLSELAANLTEEGRAQLENPEISADLKISGTDAYPDVNGDGLELVKEGEGWKLDDFDLPEL
jgi:hypothetical protein